MVYNHRPYLISPLGIGQRGTPSKWPKLMASKWGCLLTTEPSRPGMIHPPSSCQEPLDTETFCELAVTIGDGSPGPVAFATGKCWTYASGLTEGERAMLVSQL